MKKNKRTREYRPSGWQLDPIMIRTQRVQYWANGLYAGSMTQEKARQLVADGHAFVICDQAVGAMVDGVSNC